MANVLAPTSVSELQRNLYLRAKLHPDGQFQDLYDALCREDVLQQAYLLCRARNTHAPGIDGKRLVDIATFGARKWLKALELELTSRTYRPAPLLRIAAPFPDRPFSTVDIPTIRDEVCMTAMMLVLEPIIAAWLGVRTPSIRPTAPNQISDEQWKPILDAGPWCAVGPNAPGWRAYVAGVSHLALMLALTLRIVDRGVLDLFAMWLACPIIKSGEETDGHKITGGGTEAHGFSTDLPISPLLAYLVAPKFLLANKRDIASQRKPAGLVENPASLDSPAAITRHNRLLRQWARTAFRDTRLGAALFLSILLHAVLLAIEFGEPGAGLPFLGLQSGSRQANVSVFSATLKSALPPVPPVLLPVVVEKQAPADEIRVQAKPALPPRSKAVEVASAPMKGFNAQVVEAKVSGTKRMKVPTQVLKPRKKRRPDLEVLSVKAESTWSTPVTPATPDGQELVRIDPPVEIKPNEEGVDKEALARIEAEKLRDASAKAEADRIARQRVEDLARNEAEAQKQATAAKVAEDAMAHAESERQRQAKLVIAKEAALARQTAEALALSEAENARQLLEAKAEEQRKIKQARVEAEALAQAEALNRQRREDQARIETEKIKLASAKAKEEALARVEAERQQQAAIQRTQEELLARQRRDAQARIDAEKAQQVLDAKAAAERLAKKTEAEAEALARERAFEAAERAKKLETERGLAAEQAKAALASSLSPSGSTQAALPSDPTSSAGVGSGREMGTGQSAGNGRDLASRALDAARNSPSALLSISPADTQVPRRASILGRDPKDIQLAFYGDGWRQKVERVGAMNFPKLSKFLVYDPMVVTVSINSDGTLAGIRIVKSSGHIDLDNRVRRIIEMSAPFAAFPPSLKRSFDVADITRTWVFVGDRPQLSQD